MAVTVSALMAGARSVASHPITKGGALATLITGGLCMTAAAGIAIPGWAYAIGPVLGTVLYKFLPPKIEEEIDEVAEKVTDTFNDIPTVYPEYPVDPHTPVGNPNNLHTE